MEKVKEQTHHHPWSGVYTAGEVGIDSSKCGAAGPRRKITPRRQRNTLYLGRHVCSDSKI